MSQWLKLIEVEKVPLGESRCVELQGKPFGIFHLEDGFHVIDNLCPHKGAPLHEGFVQNGVVVCPWHQWEFQVSDGKCLSLPNQAVESYPVQIKEESLWIEVKS
ncbi:MAG: Rieske (2Fe-2S) protein [Verrucomicrobiota bacterium]